MSPSEFANEQLGVIRQTFFAEAVDSEFYQQRDTLLQAIAFPAAHLKKRYSVSATDSLYRKILKTVIETIVEKGNRAKIKRFNVYFLHCVQQRMAHHGEEYYAIAKAARTAAESLDGVLAKVQIGNAERDTEVLVELHRTLKSKGGRKKRSAGDQLDLVLPGRDSGPVQDACRKGAQPTRDSKNLLKPREIAQIPTFSSQSRPIASADS